MKGKFYSIGVGPGDCEYITLKAKKVLEGVEVIAVPTKRIGEKSTAFEIIKDVINLSSKEILILQFSMDKSLEKRSSSRSEAAKEVVKKLNEGKNVAMITLGDVSIYSTGAYLNKEINKQGYETEIIAGIPSFCAGAAKAGISLCEGNETLAVIPSVTISEQLSTIIDLFDNILIMKAGGTMDQIYKILEEKDLIDHSVVLSRIGMTDEFVGRIDLNEDYGYFTTVIIKKAGLE